jgi:hypothetical protein
MSGPDKSESDASDRRRTLILLAVLGLGAVLLALLAVWGAMVLLPDLQAWVTQVFAPGLGLRTAAIIAAVVSFLAIIVMTMAAGDGLIGEVQFMIPGFFLFFLFFWLMTAWVF